MDRYLLVNSRSATDGPLAYLALNHLHTIRVSRPLCHVLSQLYFLCLAFSVTESIQRFAKFICDTKSLTYFSLIYLPAVCLSQPWNSDTPQHYSGTDTAVQ